MSVPERAAAPVRTAHRGTIALEDARVTADEPKRIELYCQAARIINQNATWFWTFQNTYYAIAKASVKGIPKQYGGVIDVSEAWLE